MCATSMRTARTAKQVKMTPYLFTRLRPRRTWKGQSIPTDVKGGRSGVWRSTGRSAIFCSQTRPWRRRRRHTWRVLFFRRKWWSKTMYQALPCSRLFWSGELACVTLRHNVFHKDFIIFQQSRLSLQFPFQPVCVLHSLRNVVWYWCLTIF